jgi:hypothetical protein
MPSDNLRDSPIEALRARSPGIASRPAIVAARAQDAILDAGTPPKIEMPNRSHFVSAFAPRQRRSACCSSMESLPGFRLSPE